MPSSLQSEYFKRHSIQEPLIEYVKEGYLFLKSNNPIHNPKWRLLSIKEVHNGNHPNHSILLESQPTYNGYDSSKSIYDVGTSDMTFDTYYQTLRNVILKYKKAGFEPILDIQEAKIVLMEIFIYIWCGYTLDYYGDKLLPYFYEILNKNKSIGERVVYLDKIEVLFNQDKSHLRDFWRSMKRYVSDNIYCDWIKTWNLSDD